MSLNSVRPLFSGPGGIKSYRNRSLVRPYQFVFSPSSVPNLALWLDRNQGVYQNTSRTFNGTTQYFSRASEASLQTGDIDWWFGTWVRSTATGDRCVAGKGAGGANYEWELLQLNSTGRLGLYILTTAIYPANSLLDLPQNEWVFAFVAHDSVANEVTLRINGRTPVVTAYSAGTTAGTGLFTVGRAPIVGNEFWSGQIGPAFFGKSPPGGFATTPAATIASTLYQGGLGTYATGLSSADRTAFGIVAGWGMNDVTGDAADDIGGLTLTANSSPGVTAGVVDGPAASPGDAVALWEDLSGNGRDYYQATLSKRPTMTINSLQFDGVDDALLTELGFTGLSAGTGFIVVSVDTDPPPSSAKSGLWTTGTDSNTHYPFDADGVIYDHFGSSVRKTTVNPATTLAQFNVYGVISNTNLWENYLNGVQLFTTATNTVAWPTTANTRLGGNTGETILIDGNISEFLVYGRQLNSSEMAAVNNYLKNKWGTP